LFYQIAPRPVSKSCISSQGAIFVLMALVIFAACVSVAQDRPSSPEAGGADVVLFRSINGAMNPAGDGVFEYVDRAAIPAFFIIPLAYTAMQTIDKGYVDNSSYLFLVTETLTLGLSAGLKAVTSRPRPFEELQNVRTKHLWSAIGSSFPSGHAAQAFSIATFLTLRHPSVYVAVPAYVWASIVSYGRVYLGLHYPSDVLAGVVVGSSVAVLVWVFKDELVRFKNRIFSSDDVQLSVGGHHSGNSLRIVRICFSF
jgi:membrane-associated phospholipid phosphatase